MGSVTASPRCNLCEGRHLTSNCTTYALPPKCDACGARHTADECPEMWRIASYNPPRDDLGFDDFPRGTQTLDEEDYMPELVDDYPGEEVD